jgi:probable HAF family extracellular repeat protein
MNTKLFNVSLFTACVFLATTSPANAVGYNFFDLGTLGGNPSYAYGINNAGQVAGVSVFDNPVGPIHHATVWDGTELHTRTDLGTALEGSSSYAFAINDSGQVAGFSFGNFYNRATLWNGITPTDLGTLGGSISWANDINDSGQVVGYSHILGNNEKHATLWDATALHTPTDLGTLPGGRFSYAYGINNAGQVVGMSYDSHSKYHAILWDGTALHTPTSLTTLEGVSGHSTAFAINDSGQVAGFSSKGSFVHATIWDGTALHTPTQLGTILGADYSAALAINNAGQVVGWSTSLYDSDIYHATIWDGTALHTPTDLNQFLSVSEVNAGWVLVEARGINDNGLIVGNAHNLITGADHAFLLTPVPEPETYALFMAGLGLMGFIARRRKNGQS